MTVDITPVQTQEDIDVVAALAEEIWTSHYTSIIGKSQVEYMLGKFQSRQAITSQISDGQEYYLVSDEIQPAGYTAIVPDSDNNKMKISKLYTLSSVRGKGLGQALLRYIENKCKSENIPMLWLTVNKYNHEAISWYQHHGFSIKEKIKIDIGEGFFMDDYIMEKCV
ncbi:MAG: GNAT family N-acetyltransferase [Gammaproteobacteria bacterium]